MLFLVRCFRFLVPVPADAPASNPSKSKILIQKRNQYLVVPDFSGCSSQSSKNKMIIEKKSVFRWNQVQWMLTINSAKPK
jgi:hypothetical protein